MIAALAALAALGLGGLLCWLQPKRPGVPAFLLAVCVQGWLMLAGLSEAHGLVLLVLAWAAALAWQGPGWVGILLSMLGAGAWLLRPLLDAAAPLSRFWGLLAVALPFLLMFGAAAAAFFAVHEDAAPFRRKGLTALLAVFVGLPWLFEEYLTRSWDYGSGSLREAAGLPVAGAGAPSAIMILKSDGVDDTQSLERMHAVGRLDASRETLERARGYLDERGWRSLYKKEALLLLRRGWLDHWETERALEALSVHVPGEVTPDYASALALLRAGPLTNERLEQVRRLDELAVTVKGGFESVSTSQKIFEAFSAAYARWGDEERSRHWLLRVDKLWPLYDRKIEVAPLEEMRDGIIQGSVLIDGRGAVGIKVGLFLETLSETTGRRSIDLAAATWPDTDGRFRFESLGAGTYHLELMGSPELLRGAVLGSPGLIDLYESSRLAVLPSIMIERRALPSPVDGARRVLPGMRAPLR